ncbi:MAG TPA: D-alanyl-D-alanine carboxypeptidase/D-alanyl-D-alanine-endopeptidase [Streptomyces sp.]|uniref:D-alanyl-D-alanine carboxypeptidase/D-alanyl-D-alanine endopeptidase n=1 Tax=Streptomyces sp. TaxID=1931 RepID=UPI002D2CCB33|nr:D-alanyl-D-alanine carboxypeptidase/D-alanyl-D-alanine-endopeptidase [Streptomyces sp.]HZG03657.1 D-alanyl-D-alanine carboxypeptidase/D-alanyl-D-alanine-endopeptidase [Streptomyces sp.]
MTRRTAGRRLRGFRTRAWAWPTAAGLALTLTWSTLTWSPPAGADPADDALKAAIDRVLADERLDGAAASVVVGEADTGRVLYRHRADDRLMPASNVKLVTSAAAMELLGPDHRFRTEVLSDGRRRGPVLRGDLYLRGTGDPTMLAEDYDRLAEQVAATGIRHVTGRLIADDTRFDDQRLGRSWAADDESAYYSSQISPLTVAPDTDYDAGTVYVRVVPGAEPGDRPKVTVTPPTDYVTVDVRGTTVAAGEPDTLSVEREHGRNTIVVSGNIPVGADPTTSWTSVWEPTGYAAAVFADALAAHGVRISGGTRLGRPTPPSATVLAGHDSMPLADLLVPFMKLSNNNHAEVLVKAIGHKTSGRGTWSTGLSAVADYLEKEGIDTGALRQVDGSGLSRLNNMSAGQLARLLTAVRDAPWFDRWRASLPVACGQDRMVGGTLRSRMCGTPAAGNARAKTGSLTGASALSGYVTDADGRELVFSVVLNNYLAPSVKGIEDALVVALASHGEDGEGGGDGGDGRSRGESAEKSGTETAAPRFAPAGAPPAGLECSWAKPRNC